MADLLTISQIAKKLNIPESTVRFYRDRFPEFYPYRGEGRQKRYLPQALEVTQRIAKLYAEGQTAVTIAELLKHDISTEIVIAENSSSSVAVVENKTILTQLQLIQERQNLMEQKLEEHILKRDQQIMQLLRVKIEENNNRPWWRFWK